MMRGHRAARAILAFGLVVLPVAATFAPGLTQSAVAQDEPNFDALANAYGFDFTLTNPSLPLGLTVEGAAPVAQAHLNSIGNSDAFGSFPYFGDTVNGLPGLAGALVGLPVPEYPLTVTTQAGDPPKYQGLPGISLSAQSGAQEAEGQAVAGTDVAGFRSTARVEVTANNDVQASAETTLGLNLLNIIAISGIDSTATVVADGTTGELTRTSHLSIGEISIPGLNIAIPPGTPGTVPIPDPVPGLPQVPPLNLPILPLPFGGTTLLEPDLGFEDGTFTVALPGEASALKFAIPATLVLNALKVLGITVTYEQEQDISTGVVAPVLTFSLTLPSTPANKIYNGPTPVSFSLGRSTASVTVQPVAADLGGDVGTQTQGVGGSGTTSGAGGFDLGSTPSGTIPNSTPLGTTPLTTSGGTGTQPGGQPSGGNTSPRLVVASSETSQVDLSGLYLTCIGLAAVIGAALLVLRLMGVRLRWGF